MAWLRLIRWTNLLIVFMTQLLVWLCVIVPLDDSHKLLHTENFILLSLSTVLIAAAGYIINDYFDIRIDNINRPQKMVLEKSIPRRQAILLHSLLNLLGITLAAVVARRGGHYHWLWIQIICTVLLWFYSTHFKRQFMVGNVIVALLTALTIIVVVVYEPALAPYMGREAYGETSLDYLQLNPAYLLYGFIFFAFVLTWMREIVKDMEDFKGDEAEGCVTMPIRWGLRPAGRFTQGLGALAIAVLLFCSGNLLLTGNWLLGSYTFIALVCPLAQWTFRINSRATTEHYARASRQLKIIMVLGIGSLIINDIMEWLR